MNALPEIKAMVFGNINDQSGCGIVLTTNPFTGDMEYYGKL
jgi:hypothetical protein